MSSSSDARESSLYLRERELEARRDAQEPGPAAASTAQELKTLRPKSPLASIPAIRARGHMAYVPDERLGDAEGARPAANAPASSPSSASCMTRGSTAATRTPFFMKSSTVSAASFISVRGR